jgi:hypothetical protein
MLESLAGGGIAPVVIKKDGLDEDIDAFINSYGYSLPHQQLMLTWQLMRHMTKLREEAATTNQLLATLVQQGQSPSPG